jgi:hypothetical protein
LDRSFRADLFFRVGALLFPREFFSTAKIEELEGALGTAAGGDVSLILSISLALEREGKCGGRGKADVHMSQVLGDDQPVVPY